jgi:2-polyprenyl-3-methyl-5-hydroxy-6-metoxy-1,4-benzoquinol methylase
MTDYKHLTSEETAAMIDAVPDPYHAESIAYHYEWACRFLKQGCTIADLGSNWGENTKIMYPWAMHIDGFEIADRYLNYAREHKTPNIDYIKVDLNYPGDVFAKRQGKYDFVTCFETWEHVQSSDKLMQIIAAILKPEGIALISTPNKDNTTTDHEHEMHHINEVTPTEMKECIEREGFRITGIFGAEKLQRIHQIKQKNKRIVELMPRWARNALGKALIKELPHTIDELKEIGELKDYQNMMFVAKRKRA